MIVLNVLGNWILIVVHFFKQTGLSAMIKSTNTTDAAYDENNTNGSLIFFITMASIGSYAIYFGVGGFLHVSSDAISYQCKRFRMTKFSKFPISSGISM